MAIRKTVNIRPAQMSSSESAATSKPIVRKYGIRFAKEGMARFLSHHDLLRFWAVSYTHLTLPTIYSV